MTSILLDICYLMALIAYAPVLLWRRWRYGKNRRGWASKLWGSVSIPSKSTRRRLWCHAVSVGEVHLLAPLIEQMEKTRPDWELVISTGTETGFDAAQKKYPRWPVCFCPWDFSWAVRRAVRRIDPDVVALVELELWPNLARVVKQHGARLAIVNARLSDRSFTRYRLIRWVIGPLLRRVDLIAAQSAPIAQRFVALGADAAVVHAVGNLKFDGAVQHLHRDDNINLPAALGIADHDFVFVAGSTQPTEDQMAVDTYLRLRHSIPNLRLVVAPRHPANAPRLAELLERHRVPYRLRSRGIPETPPDRDARPVIVVDVLGELAAWWRRADVAYVGGSQGARGGQNMIEPAAFGVPICFGPRTENFRDVVQTLLAADAARVVATREELVSFVEQIATDREFGRALGRRGQLVVQQNLGAAATTVHLLESIVGEVQRPAPLTREVHVASQRPGPLGNGQQHAA